MQAALTTAGQAWGSGSRQPEAPDTLDQRFEHLRVHMGRQSARMVRADPPRSASPRWSTWYSADGAVLRLDDGRLLGFTDGQRSWQTRHPEPSWDWAAIASGAPLRYARVVDQQPGYRIGQPEQRVVEAKAGPPPEHRFSAPDSRIQWFADRDPEGRSPTTWYAVEMAATGPRVRYGQVCAWAQTCLSWEPLSPKTRP